MAPSNTRILIIGAGSRGTAYARAIHQSSSTTGGTVVAPEEEFTDWRQFLKYEEVRRKRQNAGETVEPGIDAVIVCVLDEMHVDVVEGLAPLGLHVLCEKPLATRLEDCVKMYRSLAPEQGRAAETIFGIGHVLRYSPHNMLLRELLLDRGVVEDVVSVEHTEPVGWWHFSHSYVRGNWRKGSKTAPSLLTKSCHDIDFLLWLLCSPPTNSQRPPHLPSFLTSTGSLKFFRKSRKPAAAGDATNCLSCSIEKDCMYSAKKIYLEKHLAKGDTGWPVKIVNPEIEDLYRTSGIDAAADELLRNLAEDYTPDTPVEEVESRPWFGRCVWESDNDVVDDQCVTITWEDDPLTAHANGEVQGNGDAAHALQGRTAKTATFHMIAFTEAICERRGRIYGTKGEITYDSKTISVHDFASGETKVHHPHLAGGGHGGGDDSLARQFVLAVDAVKSGRMDAEEAQRVFLGCSLEEVVRSHAMVFAAEEARRERKVVDWAEWWEREVTGRLQRTK
ncbi:hypothetical protein H2199_000467 [Coniosporium tulheliwenetii]|uniref:Uncharacterized protein n=1 Tax=Coniosporium tulheliwenetii TaxID=3383036 RepID=A0ACC2ZQ98_9PEZI|nr:hypothetical protein H2199_000467 [Cladosporium sp. JES 115]